MKVACIRYWSITTPPFDMHVVAVSIMRCRASFFDGSCNECVAKVYPNVRICQVSSALQIIAAGS